MIERKQIKLGDLANFIDPELIDSADPLDPYDYDDEPVIVEMAGGKIDLLDGYHRIAGLIANDTPLEDYIDVINCTVAELTQFAADKSSDVHEAAIDIIQRLGEK